MGNQAITWASFALSSKVPCGIYQRTISQEALVNLIRNKCSNSNYHRISQG